MAGPVEKAAFIAAAPQDLDAVARALLDTGKRILLLEGELGAGKTTLVIALCRALGSPDEVSSPTFSLINEYRDASDQPVFHIDLYRLSTQEEALRIGIEEYLYSGAWCFIEWPGLIEGLVGDDIATWIRIAALDDGTRRIAILK